MAGTANTDMTDIDVDLDSSSFIIPSSKELKIQAGITLEIFFLQYSLLQLLSVKSIPNILLYPRLTFSHHCQIDVTSKT